MFVIAPNWKQPTCQFVGEPINKLWPISKIDYYSGIKKNRLLTHTHNCLISFTRISNTGENCVEKFRTVVGSVWGYRLAGMRHGDGNGLCNRRDLGCTSVCICQPQIIYFRLIHFIVWKFYLKRNKGTTKNTKLWLIMHAEVIRKKVQMSSNYFKVYPNICIQITR